MENGVKKVEPQINKSVEAMLFMDSIGNTFDTFGKWHDSQVYPGIPDPSPQ